MRNTSPRLYRFGLPRCLKLRINLLLAWDTSRTGIISNETINLRGRRVGMRQRAGRQGRYGLYVFVVEDYLIWLRISTTLVSNLPTARTNYVTNGRA